MWVNHGVEVGTDKMGCGPLPIYTKLLQTFGRWTERIA
jgi:hypothetical protein